MAKCQGCASATILLVTIATILTATVPVVAEPAPESDVAIQDLKRLSLEDLADLEVTIFSKRPEPLGETPAAVFVMTAEDIRRSGAKTIAETLRMVPGVNVARIGTSDWAVSARGFNGQLANKLLVLIDGRSVYTPLFSGVFWDAQDIPLSIIERIEVIRGPGAASWGANAVNGVINIITKSTLESGGGSVTLIGGNQQHGVGAQFDGQFGNGAGYRFSVKAHDRENMPGPTSQSDWDGGRAGFRMDWVPNEDHRLTVQGDVYDEDATPTNLAGVNLLGRWERDHHSGALSTLQVYFDRTELDTTILTENLNTYDAEYRFRPKSSGRHNLVLGAGFRHTRSSITPNVPNDVVEPSRSDNLLSAFAQDDLRLADRWFLTLGTKVEENDYTGFELQPSTRIRWLARPATTIWGAISRAVRTPSRGEDDLIFESLVAPPSPSTGGLPVMMRSVPDRSMVSEELMAYEMGLRWRGTSQVAVDVALFYNDYDRLRTIEIDPGPPVFEPLPSPRLLVTGRAGNNLAGSTRGGEFLVDWRPLRWWRIQSALSVIDISLETSPISTDPAAEQPEGESPEHQLSVRSLMDLPGNLELDVWARVVDDLPAFGVGAYETVDVRLAWHPRPDVQLAIIGRNLIDDPHQEFGDVVLINGTSSLVKREFLFMADWTY